MFNVFQSKPFHDAQLGELSRSRGYWKGGISLPPSGTFRLSLAGNREGPDSTALALAKELPGRLDALVPSIQTGLFDHYVPYKEAHDASEETGPQIASEAAVWPHVKPAHVLIEPIGGAWTIEIAFRTAWDVEHTVAAIVRDWRFVELNGSVRGQ